MPDFFQIRPGLILDRNKIIGIRAEIRMVETYGSTPDELGRKDMAVGGWKVVALMMGGTKVTLDGQAWRSLSPEERHAEGIELDGFPTQLDFEGEQAWAMSQAVAETKKWEEILSS